MNEETALKRRALHNKTVGTDINGGVLRNTTSVMKLQERSERQSLVLHWRPFLTLYYFLLECKYKFVQLIFALWRNRLRVFLVIVLISVALVLYFQEGDHQQVIHALEKQVLWYSYWVFLGILSSVGLGTGLHTFLLYLGPFIAKVTMAAYECESLDFPKPPYPENVVCPQTTNPDSVTLLTIMSKVRWEAMMWGAGTAIGELPPYFMARAARLSGTEDEIDDEGMEEILELERGDHVESSNVLQRGVESIKRIMHGLVHRAGFVGILLCASIPNPLFDLAGITCGHFLIPFWTFFGATLIGKAIIKMHLQKVLVIVLFSQHHVETIIEYISKLPYIGEILEKQVGAFVENQKSKYHSVEPTDAPQETPLLAWLFEKLVIIMIVYFIYSIINSLAQSYHKRLCQENRGSAHIS